MKVTFALTILTFATITAANPCLDSHGCRPFDRGADATSSVLELRQRGSRCMEEAEALPRHSRNECYAPLDQAGIQLFNVASHRRASADTAAMQERRRQYEESRRAYDEERRRERETQERLEGDYRRQREQYDQAMVDYRRRCEAYQRRYRRPCQ
jgi:hypothetical protein